ncbi:TraB/GumN family protein [Chitinophaga qingshengii]|uniref:TraB/GumN family protein n=1 Tax=Chitinophaga qingshengii TaxID=1569794 RepID=A0ABR7TWC3_9BACT|nr:TraB/GumN family protein [Chitinophaga qingshengii]MBC9934727.1 TraB/GumN family protein [Chitinophaga qingshengii]
MKHLRRKLSFAIAVIGTLTTAVHAATPSPTEKALLWKISGNGLDKPSYLFGTFHLLCKDDFMLRENVKEAFSGTAQLVMEANIFDPAELKVAQRAVRSDIPQSQRLSKEKYALIDSVLRARAGVPLQRFDSIRLSALVSIFAQLSFSCPQQVNLESILYQRAQQQKMKIAMLETMEEQVDYMNKGFSDEYFFKYLTTLDSQQTMTARMINAYKTENIDVLRQEMGDQDMTYWLLTRRNTNWADRMPDMMKANSCFFAVGSGHLAGDTGVIALLRKKGYTVTPVLN